MAINDVLSNVAIRLGLKDTEITTLQRKQLELNEQIRQLNDVYELQLVEADKLDKLLLQTKKRFDVAGPTQKSIIKLQLKDLFDRQDGILQPAEIAHKTISIYQEMINKLGLLVIALQNPTNTEAIEDIAADYEDCLGDLEDAEKQVSRLKGVKYKGVSEASEVDQRIASIGATVDVGAEKIVDPLDERIATLV